MQGLGSGAAVLRIWEDAAAASPERRGSAIVASATAQPVREIEALPLGRRDRRLLELRRGLFGEAIEARGDCPACAAAVEASFGVGHMLDGDAAASETIDIVHGDLRLTVCAPSAGEIAALTRQYGGDGDADIESVRRALLQSCVVRCQTASGKAADLPEDADAAVAAAVETLDPLAAIALTLTCPHCNAAFETPFDPTDFVWRELATAANRLLWEVDQLARAYSWPEADILALSPTRRRAYLEIAAG